MAERDLPSIEEFRDGMAGVAPTMRQQIDRLTADLAACRASLAALVESARLVQHEAWFGDWQAIEIGEVELVAARGWLAAHPEGGQDGAVR